MESLLPPCSPPQASRTSACSPKSPYTPLAKITEEVYESDITGKHEDTPIPSRKVKTKTMPVGITKKPIFDDQSEDSPIRNADGKRTPEKLSAKAPIQTEEFMYYSKQDVDALLNQINTLQQKVDTLTASHHEALENLEAQEYTSLELTFKLQQQEKHFQDRTHQNMSLLSQKAREQEHGIQQIKVNMQNMTKSYKDKSEELENKKKKLMEANKEIKQVRMQLSELKEKLQTSNRLGEENQKIIEEVNREMICLREDCEYIEKQNKEELQQIKHQMNEKEEEITNLKNQIELLADAQKSQQQMDEENKLLINENNTLYTENKTIMDENKILRRYLESVKDQNLNQDTPLYQTTQLPEMLKYDENQIMNSEVQMFDQNIESARENELAQNQNNETFADDNLGKKQNLFTSSEFYNPVPQRTFNKFTQPSLQLASSSRQAAYGYIAPNTNSTPSTPNVLYTNAYSRYIPPVKFQPSSLQIGSIKSLNRNRKTIQNNIENKYMFN